MNDQKIIDSIIAEKCANALETISAKDAKKYEIPDFALYYDGTNAPEAGIFVDSEEKLKTGDLVFANNLDLYAVITHILPNNSYIATKAISGPKVPVPGVDMPQVPYVD